MRTYQLDQTRDLAHQERLGDHITKGCPAPSRGRAPFLCVFRRKRNHSAGQITPRNDRVAFRFLHGHRASLTPSRELLQDIKSRFLTLSSGLNPHPLASTQRAERGTNEALHQCNVQGRMWPLEGCLTGGGRAQSEYRGPFPTATEGKEKKCGKDRFYKGV